ncbi:MAG: SDR family NAD(P)-dependent oxidoreductase, partial [Ktedonobacterales bacterium]
MQLQDHAFLITGGGSGLGAACARRFVAAGASVVLADVNAQTGEQTAAALGARARFAQADVTDEASIQQALDTARAAFGTIHGLVNCAGVAIAQRVLGKGGPHPLAGFAKVVQVNLIGTFNVIRL